MLTCDIDSKAIAIAESFYRRSPHGHKVQQRICKASDLVAECYDKGMKFDMIFIDADKKSYLGYLKSILNTDGDEKEALLKPSGLIIVDNTLWKNLVLEKVWIAH